LSNIAPLLDRNRAFAADPGARQGMPRLPFIPNLNLYIVTCIDPRVDPAQILGVKLGEAIVERDIGGRITPAMIRDDERTLADTPVLDPARTVRTDVERVLWAEEVPQNVHVSGHVYDVGTGLVTTIVDAKARK
jgi:carbonic anhydrase